MSEIKVDTISESTSSQGVSFTHAPKTDTISEKTSGSGVTIDSVLLKDGAVQGGTLQGNTLKDYTETDVTITYGTTIAIDLANGNTGTITLTGNVSGGIDFTNVPTDGVASFTLRVIQDGTGGRTMDIDEISLNGGSHATGKTPGRAGVTLSTGANAVDIMTFLFFDASDTSIYINLLKNFS